MGIVMWVCTWRTGGGYGQRYVAMGMCMENRRNVQRYMYVGIGIVKLVCTWSNRQVYGYVVRYVGMYMENRETCTEADVGMYSVLQVA